MSSKSFGSKGERTRKQKSRQFETGGAKHREDKSAQQKISERLQLARERGAHLDEIKPIGRVNSKGRSGSPERG